LGPNYQFRQADTFHNGEVTHSELENYFARSADHVADSIFITGVCSDYGGTGHAGFINLQEFCALVETICLMTEEELLMFGFTGRQRTAHNNRV
jgi:hypothetical protein